MFLWVCEYLTAPPNTPSPTSRRWQLYAPCCLTSDVGAIFFEAIRFMFAHPNNLAQESPLGVYCGVYSGGLLSRATDLESGKAFTWGFNLGVHSGCLPSRANDLEFGKTLTWGFSLGVFSGGLLWGVTFSGHRFWVQQRTYVLLYKKYKRLLNLKFV